jgi:hypothetical protein
MTHLQKIETETIPKWIEQDYGYRSFVPYKYSILTGDKEADLASVLSPEFASMLKSCPPARVAFSTQSVFCEWIKTEIDANGIVEVDAKVVLEVVFSNMCVRGMQVYDKELDLAAEAVTLTLIDTKPDVDLDVLKVVASRFDCYHPCSLKDMKFVVGQASVWGELLSKGELFVRMYETTKKKLAGPFLKYDEGPQKHFHLHACMFAVELRDYIETAYNEDYKDYSFLPRRGLSRYYHH